MGLSMLGILGNLVVQTFGLFISAPVVGVEFWVGLFC